MHVYNHPQVDIIAEDHTVQCLRLFVFFACLIGGFRQATHPQKLLEWPGSPLFWDTSAMSQWKKWKNVGHTFGSVAPPCKGTLASGRIAILQKWLAGCSFCAWTWVARGHLASETAGVRPFLGWKCGSKPKIGMAQHQGTFRRPRNQWVVKVTSPYQSCSYFSEPTWQSPRTPGPFDPCLGPRLGVSAAKRKLLATGEASKITPFCAG